ncbi:MAG: 4Fe-4S binding protein [Firmicutes bacterium]|nr:4Fe-4S binding protein [Bacillota bacterium]
MELKLLGNTDLFVSRLCFGTLTVGPLHQNFPPEAAAELFTHAYRLGVNFFDTAEIYGTYPSLALALRKFPEMVIATKSYAFTKDQMRNSVERARKELNRDYIDLFCLHEVENAASLRGHREALDYLWEAKAKGLIRAVGISTHTVAGVRAGATDPAVEVIHPLINREGIGIRDGSAAEMIAAIRTAKEFGKGIYAMKVLAGGHLIADCEAAFSFIRELDCVDAVAVGMQSPAEVELNLALLSGLPAPADLLREIKSKKRSLQVADWCRGCGKCAAECHFEALIIDNGKIRVNQEKCVRCGYCARVCPDFCLKIC